MAVLLVAAVVSGWVGWVYAGATSLTYDEGVYVASGVAAVTDGVAGFNPEHPPLVKLTVGALAARQAVELDGATIDARAAEVGGWFAFTDQFWEAQRAADVDDDVRRAARIGAIVWSLMAGLAIYGAAARFFSPEAGAVAAVVWWSTSTVAGLAAIVTIDVPTVVVTLGSVLAFDRYVRLPSLTRVAGAGAVLGLALTVRHSSLMLLAAAAVAVVVVHSRDWFARLAAVATLVLSALGVVWLVYVAAGRGLPTGDERAALEALVVAARGSTAGRLFSALPTPLEHRAGLAWLVLTDQPMDGFVAGKSFHGRSVLAWAQLVLIAWPPATLLMVTVSLSRLRLLAMERGRLLLGAIAVSLAAAVLPERVIGLRYLLPTLALVTAVGASIVVDARRLVQRVVIGVVVVQVALVAAHGGGLGYTNPGFEPAERWISDSDLDWGQDSERALRFIDEVGGAHTALFRGRGAEISPLETPLSEWEPDTMTGWFVAGASNLTVYERDPLSWLRGYCAVRLIGDGVLAYRIAGVPDLRPGPVAPVPRCEDREFSERTDRQTASP